MKTERIDWKQRFLSQKNSFLKVGIQISAIGLTVLIPVALASVVEAQSCTPGNGCNGGSPRRLGCEGDARTVMERPHSYWDGIIRREVTIELRYSPKCRAVWNRSGEVTSNSTVWLEREGIGERVHEFPTQHRGTYHTLMVSDDFSRSVRACVSVRRNGGYDTVCNENYWRP